MSKQIYLNNELYSKKAVGQAMDQFSQFGNFSLDKIKNYYIVTVSLSDDGFFAELNNEFCNYALFLTSSQD